MKDHIDQRIAELVWSDPFIVETDGGPRTVIEAVVPPDDPFWALWRSMSARIKGEGYTLSQVNGEWKLIRREIPDSDTRTDESILAMEGFTIPMRIPTAIDAKLLPRQKSAVRRMVHALLNQSWALDASDTGTGKTYVAAAAARVLRCYAVVVCPKAVIPAWRRILAEFGVPGFVSNYEQFKLGKTKFCRWTTLPGRNRAVIQWRNMVRISHDMLIIFDKCHMCKALSSQNTRMLISAKRQGIHLILLSGDPKWDPNKIFGESQIPKLHLNLKTK